MNNNKDTPNTEAIVNIPINKLKDFADHPFSISLSFLTNRNWG